MGNYFLPTPYKQTSMQSDMAMTQNMSPLFSNKEILDSTSKNWLTGNELMQQTGISKRDLI